MMDGSTVEDEATSDNPSRTRRQEENYEEAEAEESGSDDEFEDNDAPATSAASRLEQRVREMPFPSTYVQRTPNPELPETVTLLETGDGGKVYVVGTAHFSENSQQDVAKTIEAVKPDIVMVELCSNRVNILSLDEETLMREAQDMSLAKIQTAIKQSGMVQGLLHLLLLSISAHLTKQLGMAPGGEFRMAFKQAQKISGCRLHLGDRPIQVTLRRALGSLSPWQKLRLAWYFITSKDPISKEDVERCKQKDLLEEMLREMTGEFPALSRVFVSERDQFLAHSLHHAARPIPHPQAPQGFVPAVVVGVVGIGHVPGIVQNWDKSCDIKALMSVPESSMLSKGLRWTVRAGVVGLLSWSTYKAFKYISRSVSS